LQEFSADVDSIDERADKLLSTSLSPESESELTESIDEDVHKLGYKLDHCRRLLEGAESGAAHPPFGFDSATLKTRCAELRGAVAHLNEHLRVTSGFDRATVLEMHDHMDELEGMLDKFHNSVQQGFSFWLRRMPQASDDERLRGAPLPRGMLAAVTVDSFVDGFLIGISTSVSLRTGLVLAAANILEMGFVGAAFAATVSKCTGASKQHRNLAVATPPLVLVAAGVIGGAIGDISKSNPSVFVGFVAFGVVALLFLVTHELLIEAHDSMKDSNVLFVNLAFYAGIYAVLLGQRLAG
jgi:zinc transporter ZupT